MGTWRSILFGVLAGALVLAAPAARARQNPPYIGEVRLARGAQGDLTVDFRVREAMDQRILDTLDSGLPVRFTYRVRLERQGGLLGSEALADLRMVRVLEKDNLKDSYRLTDGGSEVRYLDTLGEAVAAMTRVEGVPLVPVSALEGQGPVLLKLKAQLQKFRLPFRLHYLFAFVSYWDLETDWYVLELPSPDALP